MAAGLTASGSTAKERDANGLGRVRSHTQRRWHGHAWGYGFTLPALIAIGLTFGYPLVSVLRYSFQAGSLGNLTDVGFDNYAWLWEDPVFARSVLNNIELLLVVPITTTLALGIALILNGQLFGWRQYRAVIFVPYILPAMAIGLVFGYLLQQNGVLNAALRIAHLDPLARDWLGSVEYVVPAIGAVIVWQQLGFGVVVFSAALLAVPKEVIEAAKIDGASAWQVQRLILVPSIRRTIEFFVVLQTITVLSSIFAYVFVLTKGGPASASSVIELYIFRSGFENGVIGVASSAVVVLLILVSVLMALYVRLRRSSVEVE